MEFDLYCQSILLENDQRVEVKYWSEDRDDDPDYDPWNVVEHMEAVFKSTGIRPNRDKNPTIYITIDGDVVAAAYTEFRDKDMAEDQGQQFDDDREDEDEDNVVPEEPEDKRYLEYSFDIAVLPKYQRQSIGYILIKECIEFGKQEGLSIGLPVKARNWVINNVAARLLEKFFGFETVATHGDGSCHMEKWL